MSIQTPQAFEIDKAVAILRALAHPVRLRIALEVARGECAVGYLEEKLDIPQPGLSQHLAVLRKAGFLSTRRKSRHIYYLVNRDLGENPLPELMVLLSQAPNDFKPRTQYKQAPNDVYAAKFATLVAAPAPDLKPAK